MMEECDMMEGGDRVEECDWMEGSYRMEGV